jgi:hypothetical protein
MINSFKDVLPFVFHAINLRNFFKSIATKKACNMNKYIVLIIIKYKSNDEQNEIETINFALTTNDEKAAAVPRCETQESRNQQDTI